MSSIIMDQQVMPYAANNARMGLENVKINFLFYHICKFQYFYYKLLTECPGSDRCDIAHQSCTTSSHFLLGKELLIIIKKKKDKKHIKVTTSFLRD